MRIPHPPVEDAPTCVGQVPDASEVDPQINEWDGVYFQISWMLIRFFPTTGWTVAHVFAESSWIWLPKFSDSDAPLGDGVGVVLTGPGVSDEKGVRSIARVEPPHENERDGLSRCLLGKSMEE